MTYTREELDERLERLFSKWCTGMTCAWHMHRHSVFWRSDCGRFAILKHGGHTIYGDRVSGSGYCPVFYALYDLEAVCYDPYPGMQEDVALRTWRGRWHPINMEQAHYACNEVVL